jgi:ADP-heptose:LPS heptosyltransferase
VQRLLVIRYGGFGDALQAASILPSLKSQGWNITWDASEQGYEVLRHDPCLDQLLVTPRGSVPEAELPEYWNARSNGFHRAINLCESVENALLMTPSRIEFYHDDAARRRLFGHRSYVEHIHTIAGTSGPYIPRYVATDDELWRARNEISGRKALTLCLAGSAEYKIWPFAPDLVDKLLRTTDFRVFLAGGSADSALANQVIESVTERCPELVDRVVDMTAYRIRDAIAVAVSSNCVVGPETGILNAAAGFKVRKVVLLSHSSALNLTKHWVNTIAISPDVSCHPCHRLHQTLKFCPRGPSGQFAACAEQITPDRVITAINTTPSERLRT